jgi:hypothetical protein
MMPESKLDLEELVSKHPKTDAAKSAKQKLAEIHKDSKDTKKKGK